MKHLAYFLPLSFLDDAPSLQEVEYSRYHECVIKIYELGTDYRNNQGGFFQSPTFSLSDSTLAMAFAVFLSITPTKPPVITATS